ncbi:MULTISPECIES: hypothetical protein [unclassified Marinovum]|uniref:hypothetical protein n=1 Tax=unclassified Marinovum TaxID=2647166 RepID=UPI003EDBF462
MAFPLVVGNELEQITATAATNTYGKGQVGQQEPEGEFEAQNAAETGFFAAFPECCSGRGITVDADELDA